MGNGQWFRKTRAEQRAAAYQSQSTVLWGLGGVALTILTSLVIPRSAGTIIGGLIVSFVALLYGSRYFPSLWQTRIRRIGVMTALAGILVLIGYGSWPMPTPKPLTAREIADEIEIRKRKDVSDSFPHEEIKKESRAARSPEESPSSHTGAKPEKAASAKAPDRWPPWSSRDFSHE